MNMVVEENAAQAAVHYICSNYNVIINDHNYQAFDLVKRNLYTTLAWALKRKKR